MKIDVFSDPHLGHHKKMIEWCNRPTDYEWRIEKNLLAIPKDHIFICMGDLCIGMDEYWHKKIFMNMACKKILVRGNHDNKSNTWYLNYGWDFVCYRFDDLLFGKWITFTHRPIPPEYFVEINVHGHLHNQGHRDEECSFAINSDKHILYSCEKFNYKPMNLENLIGKKK